MSLVIIATTTVITTTAATNSLQSLFLFVKYAISLPDLLLPATSSIIQLFILFDLVDVVEHWSLGWISVDFLEGFTITVVKNLGLSIAITVKQFIEVS